MCSHRYDKSSHLLCKYMRENYILGMTWICQNSYLFLFYIIYIDMFIYCNNKFCIQSIILSAINIVQSKSNQKVIINNVPPKPIIIFDKCKSR